MKHLSLAHLSTLDAIVRHGTLAAAATELGYTAGALTQQMDALGAAVGAPVLERTGRLVQLTDAGRVVVRLGRDLLAAERRLLEEAGAAGVVNDTLVVGIWGSTAAALIAPVVAGTRRSHPNLRLRSQEIDVDDAGPAVARRAVDVAFGLTYPDAPLRRDAGITLVRLRQERFGIAVPTGSSFPDRVGLADLAAEPWVLPPPGTEYGRALLTACRRAGFEPDVSHQVIDTAATLTLAAQGLGVAPVTDLMLRLSPAQGVRRLELTEDVSRELVLVLPAGHERRAAVAALVDVVHDVLGR